MDWANEDYVRLYQRDTDDDLLLSWDANSVWRAMLRKFDRAGVLETKRGLRGLAALLRAPLDVVERAMVELLDDGRVVAIESGYFAPNFLEAQETSKSDKQRQKESREKRAAAAKREVANKSVTFRDGMSRAVTRGHEPSQPVTLTSADPDPDPDPGLAARACVPARSVALALVPPPVPVPVPEPEPPPEEKFLGWDPAETQANADAAARAVARGIVLAIALSRFRERALRNRWPIAELDSHWRSHLVTEHAPSTQLVREGMLRADRERKARAARDREREAPPLPPPDTAWTEGDAAAAYELSQRLMREQLAGVAAPASTAAIPNKPEEATG